MVLRLPILIQIFEIVIFELEPFFDASGVV